MAVVARYAGLLAAHGDAFEGAELVTPTSEHFPDKFERDAQSVGRLLTRIVSYTPLPETVPLQIAFLEDAADDGHCTSGCSKPGARVDGVTRLNGGYRIEVPMTETSHPTRLVCALVRGVAAAVLAEADEEDEDVGMAAEVVAAACGFGVVLLEGAHVYTKSCGGPSIHQGTRLSPDELAVLLALFCALHDVAPRTARKHLGATQAEAFDVACRLVEHNEDIVEKLRTAPELLEGGAFAFEEKRGLLERLLSREPVAIRPSKRAEREPAERDAELDALIDKEFG